MANPIAFATTWRTSQTEKIGLRTMDLAQYPFLTGGGEAAEMIASFNWAKTPLGHIDAWSASLKSSISVILRSPVPIVTLWGEDGIMIYNDAYSVFSGSRHPKLFGSKVREGWPEVGDFNDNIMKVGLAGNTLAYRDFPLTLCRHDGQPEQVWLNLDYSPLLGDDGTPVGVMAIVVEITDKVRITRELDAERRSLTQMFQQAPGFIAMLSGPEHRFTMVNEAYSRLVAGRHVTGKTVAEALPEVVEQGFVDLLDKVFASGEPYIGRSVPIHLQAPDGALDQRYLDFVYQPIVADGGSITGIFIQGHDVTDQHVMAQAIRAESRKLDVLNRTGAAVAAELDVDAIVQIVTDACTELVGAEFGAFFYNVIDDKGERYMLYALSGVPRSHFDKFPMPRNTAVFEPTFTGSGVVRSDDIRDDPRYGKSAPHFGMPQGHLLVRSYIAAPVISRSGEVIGGLFFGHGQPRKFVDEHEELLVGIAGQAATAIDNARLFQAAEREVADRRRAEESLRRLNNELRESDRELRFTLEAGRFGAWTLDLKTGEFVTSATCRTNFGRDPEADFTYAELKDAIHPADRDRMTLAVDRSLETGADYDIEYRVVKPDGSIGWVLIRAQPSYGSSGAPLKMTGVSIDITERKAAEQSRLVIVELSDAIRDLNNPESLGYRASEILGRALEVSRVGYATVDPDAEILHVARDWTAPGIESLAGSLQLRDYGSFIDSLKRGEFIAISDVRENDQTASAAAALESRSVLSFVNMPVIERGRLAAVLYVNHAEARSWSNGDMDLIREVGERTRTAIQRMRAEEALHFSEESLRLAIEAAEIGTWDLDLTTNVLTWSDRTKAAFGVSFSASVDMNDFYDGLHPDDLEATSAAFATALDPAQRAVYDVEYRTIGKEDGLLRWVAAKGVGLFDQQGRCVRALGTAIDITARKSAEAELRSLNETLEQRVEERAAALDAAHERLRQSQKMEAMGNLTGGVAHDFNNLLTPIVGSLDILQRKGVGGEREQRLIAGAIQSADRAKTLVQRLLAFARRQPLQATPVELSPLVHGMAELVSSTTGPQIKVVVDAPDDLPAAKVDPNQLEMAILNLAVNARDAMAEGGVLRISVAAENVGPKHRSGLPAGRYLCLSVADTGTGMDEATLKRAVEPFFSTKGIGKGTGLGLSMVHGLASQLGGALTIRSALGVGTHVELWLPESPVSAVAVETPGKSTLIATASGRVLLVDDEEAVTFSTGEMLIELGYEVTVARSAEEAQRLIENGLQLDLLITDHLMPGMTGTDLARSVQVARPGVKVLVVSGYAEVDGIPPDLPRLTKPFRSADLAAGIAELG
jgi:PAS domain S-box-containing protein